MNDRSQASVPSMVDRYPLMERTWVAYLLAFIAGTMDAFTLFTAQTFATVQSGNVISGGYRLVEGKYDDFWFSVISVFAFGIGSMVAGIVMTELLRRAKLFTRQILFIEAIILAIMGIPALTGDVDPHHLAYVVSFVAGMQGNAFHKTHGMLYGNVAVTFVVQMAFNFLIQSVFNKKGINGEPNLMWARIFFLVLIAFSAGGGVGFLAVKACGVASLWLPAILLVILGCIAIRDVDRKIATDPTMGGMIG